MAKITKIDLIRNELRRISSCEDRLDPITPTMTACWSFAKVMILGKTRSQAFDFDYACDILTKVPTGSGESTFWRIVDAANLAGPANPARPEGVDRPKIDPFRDTCKGKLF